MRLFLATSALSFLLLTQGCGSTPTATATAAAGVQVLTVDTAMKAWKDYVVARLATNPNQQDRMILQSKIDTVHTVYDRYEAAARVEQAAITALVTAGTNAPTAEAQLRIASEALMNSQTNLINLITQFKGKAK